MIPLVINLGAIFILTLGSPLWNHVRVGMHPPSPFVGFLKDEKRKGKDEKGKEEERVRKRREEQMPKLYFFNLFFDNYFFYF
jgi:hypothetical protein